MPRDHASRNHALIQPFSNRWDAGDQVYEWTTRGDDLLLRPQGAPPSHVWVMLNTAANGPQLSRLRARVEALFPASPKTSHALYGRLLWRLRPLSTQEMCLVRAW